MRKLTCLCLAGVFLCATSLVTAGPAPKTGEICDPATEPGVCVDDSFEVVFGDDVGQKNEASVLEYTEFQQDQAIDVLVVSETTSEKVQGWSYGLAHDPEALTIEAATISDTEAEQALMGGFDATSLDVERCTEPSDVDPDCENRKAGGGFISAVVLSFRKPVFLEVGKRNRLVTADYKLIKDVGTEGTLIQISRRLAAPGSPPADVNLTVDGKSKKWTTVTHGWVKKAGEICDNGQDDDGDGDVDCDDADCDADPACVDVEICDNGQDDDGDGDVDCDDADCDADPACVDVEICDNGQDDDGDGDVDCDDADCDADPACVDVEICDNGQDDDGDGDVDCDDADCDADPACVDVEICDNGQDDDGDGDVDCDDADCAADAACKGEFIRGDPNDDGKSNIADPIWMINELVREGPATACKSAADANDDGIVDLSDASYLIEYRFRAGPVPPAPFPACGPDANPDGLECPIGSAVACAP